MSLAGVTQDIEALRNICVADAGTTARASAPSLGMLARSEFRPCLCSEVCPSDTASDPVLYSRSIQ